MIDYCVDFVSQTMTTLVRLSEMECRLAPLVASVKIACGS